MVLSLTGQQLAVEELKPIRDFVAEKSGLFFEEKKFYFLEKRVAKRMAVTDSATAKDYHRLLKFATDDNELKELLSILTTNETYFWRNIPQLESLCGEALPIILEEKRKKGDYTLKIWSAASSSGEEAYTIAIMLRESIPDYSRWKISILGTDIDHVILEKARKAVYDKRSVKDVSPAILNKYFVPSERNSFRLKDEIKDSVKFEYLNLVDRRAMRAKAGHDIVLCRNVLIYFNDEMKKQVVNSIYDCLNKGGFIFLGHSESVGKISAAFKLIKFKKSLSYQK